MSDTIFCPQCGEQSATGDAFCGMCGTRLPATSPPPPDMQPEPPTAGSEDAGGFPLIGIVVGIALLILVGVNISDWMGWNGEQAQDEPASTTFSEWANEGIVRPQMPEKEGFTDIKEDSDAESPDSLEELLGEMLLQQIEAEDGGPAGSPAGLSRGDGPAPPDATPPADPPAGRPGGGGSLTPGSAPPPTLPGGPPGGSASLPSGSALPSSAAGARIPYIEPGGQIFVSGILQTTCQTGLEYITFELRVADDGTVAGDVLTSGWLHVPLRGSMTPAGALTIGGQSPDGDALQAIGNLRYEHPLPFLQGGGQFRLRWTRDQGSHECTGRWLTEEL